MPTIDELKMLQALPLGIKIRKSQQRIKEWVDYYGEDGVYVSFSGGKDSTVLLDIVRKMYPEIEAVFVNTGLEYPEIVDFVKQHENVTMIRPKKNFRQVLTEYGYQVIGKEVSQAISEARHKEDGVWMQKLNGMIHGEPIRCDKYNFSKWKWILKAPFKVSHKCCYVMKKNPLNSYSKETKKQRITGQMAEESRLRMSQWMKKGCNSFESKNPGSNPISFWTNNDILTYIHTYRLPIASVYGDIVPDDSGQIPGQENIYDLIGDYKECKFKTTGCNRTGCMFCLYGAHLEKGEGRLERMKKTHPKRYEYVMGGGEFDDNGMWIPNAKGLGFRFVVEWLNENGNLNIRY